MRKITFTNGEFYHIYNRGVDKRNIFSVKSDWARFLQSMDEFNSEETIGSIYENSFCKEENQTEKMKIVNIICYCLNLNHYHFILQQIKEKGIEKFMHKLGLGYTKYFNAKYKRSGALFQGSFKAIHIDSNEYLLHLSAYINLNFKIHKLGNLVSKWESSWNEYINRRVSFNNFNFCKNNIILDQFKNCEEYKKFAEDTLPEILRRKNENDEFQKLFLE